MGFIVTLMFSLSIDIYLKEQRRQRLPERKALLTRSILDRQNMRGHCMTVNIHFFSFLEKKLSWQICKIFLMFFFMCMCVFVARGWPRRPEEGMGFPAVEVTSNCESFCVGAGIQEFSGRAASALNH